MIQGAKKISELPSPALNGTEIVPVVQNQGGTLVTIQTPISSVGSDTNLANTNLTQTAATNRLYNMNGNVLQFDNGQFVVGDTMGSPYLMEVNGGGESKRGLYAQSSGLIAVRGEDLTNVGIYGITNSGIAVLGESTTGVAGTFRGGTYTETSGVGGSISSKAVLQANSTTQGFLEPRMTTTQRDAISSPDTGLQIYNTTTSRLEVYNGTFWQGVATRFIQVFHASWSPTDAQTVAFGAHPLIPVVATISPAPYEIIMRGNGVIRGCDFDSYASGTAGTNENWSLYVRHNGTDYLVQTVGTAAAVRKFSNQSLNIPYVDGDIVRMIFVNPTWATNPTLVGGTGFLRLL